MQLIFSYPKYKIAYKNRQAHLELEYSIHRPENMGNISIDCLKDKIVLTSGYIPSLRSCGGAAHFQVLCARVRTRTLSVLIQKSSVLFHRLQSAHDGQVSNHKCHAIMKVQLFSCNIYLCATHFATFAT